MPPAKLCVCEPTHALGARQPHISRHLAQPRELFWRLPEVATSRGGAHAEVVDV